MKTVVIDCRYLEISDIEVFKEIYFNYPIKFFKDVIDLFETLNIEPHSLDDFDLNEYQYCKISKKYLI